MPETNANLTETGKALGSSITSKALQKYYDSLSREDEWDPPLSDDFLLTGRVANETRGRNAYVSLGFWKLVKSLRVTELIVDGDRAFALVNSELVSPKGTPFTADVAEFWTAKHGKLDSIAIYFDTAAFDNYMSR